METNVLILSGIVCFLFLTIAVFFLFRNKKENSELSSKDDSLSKEMDKSIEGEIYELQPEKIVLGENENLPFLTIENSLQGKDFEKARPVEFDKKNAIGRLGAIVQALPSALVAQEASGKRIMEVVVNGELTKVSGADGFRAFVTSGGKIIENAKLYDVGRLQNLINVTAVWQIASVVVAQKHLADISEKLDSIKLEVEHVSRFLDNQRKSRIEATYSYLEQVYEAIKNGELAESVRVQLENSEKDLLEIQHHLMLEFQQDVKKEIRHNEMVGTKELQNALENKVEALNNVLQDIVLCIKVRTVAWYVLSLYPGEQKLKDIRRIKIQSSIDDYNRFTQYHDVLVNEISGMDSMWNSKETLKERRLTLIEKSRVEIEKFIEDSSKLQKTSIEESRKLMLKHDQPQRLFFVIENGSVSEVRQAEPLKALAGH